MRDTLEGIYHRHRQGLYVLAMAITHSRADAEDAVHDAFARLVNSPAANHLSECVAYVFAAVRNAAIDRARSRRPTCPITVDLEPCFGGNGTVEATERDRAIAAALGALSDDQRHVVMLRIYGGLTFRQIGEMLQTPLPTVVSRYTAALECLKPLLRKWT